MDDDALLAEYVRGRSEGAFGGLVERYLPLVYGAALRQVRDPGMAGDVAQAVILVLAKEGIEGREDVIEKGLGACVVAAVPAALQGFIVRAAAGHAPTAASAVLAKEVSHVMLMTKVKAAVVALVAGAAAMPVTVYAVRGWGGRGRGTPLLATGVPVAAVASSAADADGLIKLANGSTFELVGICEDPYTSHRWWDAHGKILANAPVDELEAAPAGFQRSTMPRQAKIYAFAYHVHFPAGSSGNGLSVGPFDGSFGSDTWNPRATKDQRRADVGLFIYFMQPGLTHTTLGIETSCGPWERVAHFDAQGKSTNAPAGVSLTIQSVNPGTGKLIVTCPNRYPENEYQFVAEEGGGSELNEGNPFLDPTKATGMVDGWNNERAVGYRLEKCVKSKAKLEVALEPLPGQAEVASSPALPAIGASRTSEIPDGTYVEAELKEGQMIDLDTGTVGAFKPPRRGEFEKMTAAVEAAGADLAFVGDERESMMAGLGMHVLPVEASRYFDPAPQKNLGKMPGFAVGTAGTMTFLNCATKEPATFQFVTREGGVGVMRLEVQEGGRPSVYVRCKLWRSGGA